MSTEVVVAIVTGAFTLLGVLVTVWQGNKKTQEQIKSQTDLTIYRIEQLEKKQDKHNTLIERVYRLEEDVKVIDERVKVANNRIKDLETITGGANGKV